MTYHAGKLADWLVDRMPVYGSVSRSWIKNILREHRLTEYQIEQIILVAVNRGQIVDEFSHAVFRRK